MSVHVKTFKEKNNITDKNVSMFLMGNDNTMFSVNKLWQKSFFVVGENNLTIYSEEEEVTLTLDDITDITFNKYNGNLWMKIESNKGIFTGTMHYNFYRAEESRKVMEYLLPKSSNPTPYYRLINSRNSIIYLMFGK